MKKKMTVRKAKELLKALDRKIQKLEDEAIELWSMVDESGWHNTQCEAINDSLTQRYTVRRAVRNWLTRHTP